MKIRGIEVRMPEHVWRCATTDGEFSVAADGLLTVYDYTLRKEYNGHSGIVFTARPGAWLWANVLLEISPDAEI